MRFISLMFLGTISLSVQAQSLCEGFLVLQADINPTLPRQIDSATDMIRLQTHCDDQSLTLVKRLRLRSSELPANWQVEKQAEHQALHCNADGLASRQGWTAIDVFLDGQDQEIGRLVTRPADC
jgi:hypothetical protein